MTESLTWRCARQFWAYLLVLVVVVLLRLPTLSNDIFSIDEVWNLVGVTRLQSLEEFVYAFKFRAETNQIGLLPLYLADAIDHQDVFLLARVEGLIEVVVGCWVLVAFSRRFLGGALPGTLAAIVWGMYLEVGPGYPLPASVLQESFQAIRLEYLQAPLILISLFAFAVGSGIGTPDPRPRLWPLFLAGIALSTSMLVKPSGEFVGLVYLIALIAVFPLFGSDDSRSRLTRALAGFGSGALLPVALVFGPYLFDAQALSELRFNLIDNNVEYASHTWDVPWRVVILLGALPPLVLGLFVLASVLLMMRLPPKLPPHTRRTLLLLAAAGPALFLGYIPGHAHFHYMVPVVPLLSLTVTGYWNVAASALRERGHTLVLARVVAVLICGIYIVAELPGLVIFANSRSTDAYLADDRQRFDLDGLVQYIDARTSPTDSIWIYYYVPEVYVLSGRRPATSDPAGGALTLVWDEPWFQRTLDELARERPELVVGIDNTHMARPQAGSFDRIPRVSAWIEANYACTHNALRGLTLCILSDRVST
jgi:hypothetical protein